MLVLKSAIGSDEYVAIQLLHQRIVFQMLPSEIKQCSDVIVNECFDQTWIDGGVYDDAQINWSMAMSRLSSRKAKTCCLGIVG